MLCPVCRTTLEKTEGFIEMLSALGEDHTVHLHQCTDQNCTTRGRVYWSDNGIACVLKDCRDIKFISGMKCALDSFGRKLEVMKIKPDLRFTPNFEQRLAVAERM